MIAEVVFEILAGSLLGVGVLAGVFIWSFGPVSKRSE